MKKYIINPLLILFLGIFICACSDEDEDKRFVKDPESQQGKPKEGSLDETKAKLWNFADFTEWELANQSNDPVSHSSVVDCPDCEDGKAMRIYTKAKTQERKKMRTSQKFGAGRYTWRTYISDLKIGDRASIGSWLWCDDKHELDFEVGAGTMSERAAMAAQDDEVIAYVTNQDGPALHNKVKIKKNAWHIFEIDLKLVGDNYLAEWIIDGMPVSIQQLNFGENFPFYIFCSVENLKFTGDHWPLQDNYGLYDWVKYTPYDYSMEPVTPENPVNPTDPDPEPDPGEVLRWNFDASEGMPIPSGWRISSDIGAEDASPYLISNGGYMTMTMPIDYPGGVVKRANIEYATPLGAGKYTWRLHVPKINKDEQYMTGGTLYTSNDANSQYHCFAMYAIYGPQSLRNQYQVANDELLLRCYSEIPGMYDFYVPIKADKDYTLQIDLKLVNGFYKATWLLDEKVIVELNTTFGPNKVKFLFICSNEANRPYMADKGITTKYVTKFDFVEFASY
ncbi:MAG: toxin-antitoxin system protein [Dysgonomonas sp.]